MEAAGGGAVNKSQRNDLIDEMSIAFVQAVRQEPEDTPFSKALGVGLKAAFKLLEERADVVLK